MKMEGLLRHPDHLLLRLTEIQRPRKSCWRYIVYF